MSRVICEICKQGPVREGVTVHRVNPKGEIGIWRCREHLSPFQWDAIDAGTKEIISIIEDDNKRKAANP